MTITQGSQSLALGLTLIAAPQLCCVLTLYGGCQSIGNRESSIWLLSQSLALGFTLTAASQLCCMVTS